ncbi:MAG: hypothetical protein F6K24_02825 [Okeania sp. SIO2D1]|nr:hypothetical protein [Okeania sp. SIO2D1]
MKFKDKSLDCLVISKTTDLIKLHANLHEFKNSGITLHQLVTSGKKQYKVLGINEIVGRDGYYKLDIQEVKKDD